MAKLNDPTGVFEITPRHAGYIVALDQLKLIRKALENQGVLAGYFKERPFLNELPKTLTDDPIQLAQMIASFSRLENVLQQYLMGIYAFGILTTDKQSELDTLSKEYTSDA